MASFTQQGFWYLAPFGWASLSICSGLELPTHLRRDLSSKQKMQAVLGPNFQISHITFYQRKYRARPDALGG